MFYDPKYIGNMDVCLNCGSPTTISQIPHSTYCEKHCHHEGDYGNEEICLLFQCTLCNWWCVKENWIDANDFAYQYDNYVVIGIHDEEGGQIEHPWTRAMLNDHIYENYRIKKKNVVDDGLIEHPWTRAMPVDQLYENSEIYRLFELQGAKGERIFRLTSRPRFSRW